MVPNIDNLIYMPCFEDLNLLFPSELEGLKQNSLPCPFCLVLSRELIPGWREVPGVLTAGCWRITS